MNIKSYTDAQQVARAVAEDFFVAGTSTGAYHLAVSGGSTPKALFELLATPEYVERVVWEHLHLYWVDERCVPPTDAQSNYGMTYEALLAHVPVPEHQIHRMRGEDDPEGEALRYTELVRSLLPTRRGIPAFDAILLGIGDDGHTSSIFPHQMRLLEIPTPFVVATHPSGQRRICMTGPTILEARRVAFHAVGAGKRAILSQIHESTPESYAYPAAYFARSRADLELYTDQVL